MWVIICDKYFYMSVDVFGVFRQDNIIYGVLWKEVSKCFDFRVLEVGIVDRERKIWGWNFELMFRKIMNMVNFFKFIFEVYQVICVIEYFNDESILYVWRYLIKDVFKYVLWVQNFLGVSLRGCLLFCRFFSEEKLLDQGVRRFEFQFFFIGYFCEFE